MKKIGGFFELELPKGKSLYHDDAIQLSTGRACMNYLLQTIKPTKVYIPYYCCDALYEPMQTLNIEYQFYNINHQLEILNPPKLKPREILICCDFFGIKSNYINQLITIYKEQLIIDNSHSFFKKKYTNNISFTTARKYFGVPDGAFLYMNKNDQFESEISKNVNVSINHNMHSLIGLQDLAFSEFSEYEKSLHSKVEYISVVSERLLSMVDFEEVRSKRNRNFDFYRNAFKHVNLLDIEDDEIDCFCYPLLLKESINKKELYEHKIYIPTYWMDTINRSGFENYEFECKVSIDLLPLPIDHRYSIDDLKRVCTMIKEKIKH